MSVLIRGIDMPKACGLCPFDDYGYCTRAKRYSGGSATHGRASFCPLVELPEKHGDLIDRDALVKDLTNGIKAGFLFEGYEEYADINSAEDCVECVKYADAVIEAEGEEQ